MLMRMIGEQMTKPFIADCINRFWQPWGNFTIKRVEAQSYLVGFRQNEDYDRISKQRWCWFDGELLVIKPWTQNSGTFEDVLDSIPQHALVRGIPTDMWTEEAINRIASTLGLPLSTILSEPVCEGTTPVLKICTIIMADFKHPTNIRIRVEGATMPADDTLLRIRYIDQNPFCSHCHGFGH